MPKRHPKPTEPPPAADWRAEAEARGRAAFEQAVADPQPPEPALSWLWETPTRKESR